MKRDGMNDFDSRLKSIFDGAEEEVPAHVWEAVSSRLDAAAAPARRRVIPVWFGAAASVAAAAAVVLGLFFAGIFDPAPGVSDQDNFLVEVIHEEHPEPYIPAEEIPYETPVSGTGYLALASEAAPEMPSDSPETEEQSEDYGTESDDSRPAEIPSGRKIQEITGEARSERTVDPFAYEEKTVSGIKTAVTLNSTASGISKSGTAPAMNGPMKAAARQPLKPINEKGGSTYGIPVSFGIGAKIIFTPRWALGAGLDYTLLTRTFKGTYVTFDDGGEPVDITSSDKIRNSLSYVGIPVNVYFSIINNRKIDFYAYAGGSAEKCVDNRYRIAPQLTYNEKVSGFQFSAAAGIGVEFIFADMLGLYLDPGVRYYFKNDKQPKSIRTQHPLSFGCEIGLRVRL